MTFGTAFVLRTRHKQTLPATRKAKTMFFQAKKNSRKTTRQTLSTEQLEPKAMFNAAPLQAEIGFEDRLSNDYDGNDAVLQIRSSQNVTCNTGFYLSFKMIVFFKNLHNLHESIFHRF